MTAARVAAVIVNYNRADDTIRAVRSLARLTTPVDAIVVDNGSGDGSAAVIRAACPEATVLETEQNFGFGGGNNRGIERAAEDGADYVLLLNNDAEVVEPGFVDELVRVLEEDRGAGVAAPLILFPDGSAQPTVGRRPSFRYAVRLALDRRLHGGAAIVHERRRVEFVNAVCMLVRTDVFRRVGGFDERYFMYGEEADLEQRIVDAGYSLEYVPIRSIVHHHQEVSYDPAAQLQMRRNFIRFCFDHNGAVSGVLTACWFMLAAIARDAAGRRWSEAPALGRALRGIGGGRGA